MLPQLGNLSKIGKGSSTKLLSRSRKERRNDRPEVRNSISFHFEWFRYKGRYEHLKTNIFAASFYTNWGKKIGLHISKYSDIEDPEKALIQDILRYLNQFSLTFGWHSTRVAVYDEKDNRVKGHDSDLFILHQRCIFHHLDSPVEVKKTYTRLINNKHIDLERVFSKPSIQNSIFEGKYRTTDLKSISQTLLGPSKYDGLDAGSSHIKDSELTMLLAQHNNCLVLRMMKVFAGYAEMDYYQVCNTPISYWYANLYKKMLESGRCTVVNTPNYKLKKEALGGGHHIPPIKGLLIKTNIYELDVDGLYPRIAINNNFSFDTINCTCCQNNKRSYLGQKTISAINEGLKENRISRRVDRYWVCQRRKGALPLILEQTLSDRNRYLTLSKKEKKKEDPDINLIEEYHIQQLGAKIFANAGVSTFANECFDFSNYQVNECITGEGRRIHKRMKSAVEKEPYDFKVVFGFTDSIFLKNKGYPMSRSIEKMKINDFIRFCKDELNISVKLKTIFMNSILYGKKNRYVGWTGNEDDEPIIKGLDGVNKSNPLWVRKWVKRIVIELVKYPKTRFEVIPMMINKAFEELKGHISEELKYEQRIGKEVYEYKDSRIRKLAELLGKGKGDLVYWYNIYKKGRGSKKIKSYSIESENLDLDSYKELLLKKLKNSLEIAGFDMAKLE